MSDSSWARTWRETIVPLLAPVPGSNVWAELVEPGVRGWVGLAPDADQRNWLDENRHRKPRKTTT